MAKSHVDCTREDLKRALFVDFESVGKKGDPNLIGYAIGYGEVNFIVTDAGLAEAAKARKIPVMSFQDAAKLLVDLCESEERKWVSYSRQELNRTKDCTGIDIGPHYVNAHTLARRWAKREGIEVEKPGLKVYTMAAGLEPQKRWMEGEPRKWVMSVRSKIRKRGSYKEAGKKAKRCWGYLLWYNRMDCEYMRQLLEVTLRD